MDFSVPSFFFLSCCSEFGEAIQEEDFEAFVDCDKEAECFENLTDAEICDSVKLNRQGMLDLKK